MALSDKDLHEMAAQLREEKSELENRVNRIHEHARDPLESDSSEQAAQLGNVAVVSALENEATQELAEINAALQRIEAGTYGKCVTCGETIQRARLVARPASTQCVGCAEAAQQD